MVVPSKILVIRWYNIASPVESCCFHCRCLLHMGILNFREEALCRARQPRIIKLTLVRELYVIHDAVVRAGA